MQAFLTRFLQWWCAGDDGGVENCVSSASDGGDFGWRGSRASVAGGAGGCASEFRRRSFGVAIRACKFFCFMSRGSPRVSSCANFAFIPLCWAQPPSPFSYCCFFFCSLLCRRPSGWCRSAWCWRLTFGSFKVPICLLVFFSFIPVLLSDVCLF